MTYQTKTLSEFKELALQAHKMISVSLQSNTCCIDYKSANYTVENYTIGDDVLSYVKRFLKQSKPSLTKTHLMLLDLPALVRHIKIERLMND